VTVKDLRSRREPAADEDPRLLPSGRRVAAPEALPFRALRNSPRRCSDLPRLVQAGSGCRAMLRQAAAVRARPSVLVRMRARQNQSVSARDVIAELRRPPVYTIAEAKSPSGAPVAPGFYAWWTVPGAILGVPSPAHPVEPVELLYVGIAPTAPGSSARLRSRLCRQHIGGNVASSTFRFGLASLLWELQEWTPWQSPSGKYRLLGKDNQALSAWQRHHLRVRWAVVDDPWRFEADVIRAMKPPMNRQHNERHPFYERMGKARSRFRAAAQPP
jgi:hypothetical protein